MRVKIEDVPQALRRRAATMLESVRNTPMAPNSGNARLGDVACPIYRPDVRGVAYWEFEIAGLKKTLARQHDGKSSGVGFVLVSVGRHDVPIPHWSVTSEPPSRALDSMAAKAGVARVVKLDALAYVAEDPNGGLICHLGQFPPMVVAGAHGAKQLQAINASAAESKAQSKDDSAPGKMRVATKEVKKDRPKLAKWKSWPAAKKEYGKVFRPQLDALRKHADAAWATEDLITEFGEGIHAGDQLVVPLLKPGKAELDRAGARHVEMTLLKREPPAVALKAMSQTGEQKEVSFQLKISYSGGGYETLRFFVVPKGSPSNSRSSLPHRILKPETLRLIAPAKGTPKSGGSVPRRVLKPSALKNIKSIRRLTR